MGSSRMVIRERDETAWMKPRSGAARMARRSVFARATTCICGTLAFALAAGLAAEGALAQSGAPSDAPPCEPREKTEAVTGGSHIQPTEKELKELGCPDVTPGEEGEVRKLYQELMDQSAPSGEQQPETTR